MPTEPFGNARRSRAGAQGLALALRVLSDRPLRECLTALTEEPASPKELVDRLGLDEDVVFECCRTLAGYGLAEKDGASA